MITRKLRSLSTFVRLGTALALGLGLMTLAIVLLLPSAEQAIVSAQAVPAMEAPAAPVGDLIMPPIASAGGTDMGNQPTGVDKLAVDALGNESQAARAMLQTEPVLQSTHPVSNSLNVTTTTTISAAFDQNLNATTVTSRTFMVYGEQSGLVTATHGVINGDTAMVTPTNAFHAGEVVRANASSQIESSGGLTLTTPYAWQFTVDARGGDDGTIWDEQTVAAAFDSPRSVYAADVDGDGDLDVLGAGYLADEVAWWENTAGDGSAWTKRSVDAAFDGAESVYAADVDGDGDLDVLGAAYLADDIAWWENTAGDGTAWDGHKVDVSFDGAYSVYAADVDGDGDMDVLGAAFEADDIAWWENTAGDGTAWTEHSVDDNFNGAQSVYVADVDGDGDMDVLGAARHADEIAWWENTAGDGTAWTEHSVDAAFDGANSVYAADVDGDGDLDVLGTAYLADDIAWWENTAGDGSAWTKRNVDADFDYARKAYAADVDGDGDMDVLGSALLADEIAWWENTAGDGTAWVEHSVDAAFDGANSVYAADVDSDGDMDVLAAARFANEIAVWLNSPSPDLSIAKSVAPATALPGDPITYTLTFTNAGGSTATGVVITDSIPVSVTHRSLSVSSSGAAITATGSISYVWEVADLDSGQGGVITITGVLSDPLAAGTFTNTATITTTAVDGDSTNNSSSAGVTVQNQAPIADAGADQSVETNATVTLDGSGSSDPDGDIPLTYGWQQTGGTAITLSDATAVSPTFTAPGDPTVLTFSLTVTDSLGLADATPDQVVVTVTNQAPVADAGGDQSVDTNATVTLDGSGSSDPDGDIPLAFGWQQTGGTAITLSDATAVSPTFTAPSDPTVLTFSLTVTDSLGLADATPDQVVVTVTNQAPLADAGADQSVDTDATVTLDGSGSSDPDGDTPLTYGWQQTGGTAITLSDATAESPTFTAPGDPTVLTFSLTVTDSLGLADATPDQVVVTVTNQAPLADAGADQSVDTNTLVTLDGSGSSDPDGDTPLTYGWQQTGGTAITLSDATAVSPTFTAPGNPTVLTFSLTVTDSLGLADATPDQVVVTVTTPVVDLRIGKAAAPGAADPGQPITYTLTFTNAGPSTATGVVVTDVVPVGQVANLSYVSAGAAITATGSVSYVWDVADLGVGQGGVIIITGVLTDQPASGTFTNTATITTTTADSDGGNNTSSAAITVQNVPPSFTSTPLLTATQDVTYTYAITATDPDAGDVLTITMQVGPDWWVALEPDPATGAAPAVTATLSGVANSYYVGDHAVTLQVEDSAGATATQSFTLTVHNVNDAPYFTTLPTLRALTNITYTYAISSSDPDFEAAGGDVLTLTATAVPGWLSFTASGNGGGELRGVPTFGEIGDHDVALQLEDMAGATAVQTFTLEVYNDAPTARLDEFTVDEDSVDNVFAILDNDNNYPDDLTLTALGAPGHGRVVISGTVVLYTPDADFFGTDTFTYTVSDGAPGSPGVLDTTALVRVTVNGINDQAPQAVDDAVTIFEDSGGYALFVLNNDTEPEGDPLAITAVGAPLNGTVHISPSVQHPCLVYTPTLNFHGSDTFTYTISDGVFDASATVNMTVNSVNDPPVAAADVFTVTEDSEENQLTPLANDSDADGDELTLTGVGQPDNGGAYFGDTTDEGTILARALQNGPYTVITYTPYVDFVGTDTFTYTVGDGQAEAESTVTVVVQPGPNDAPQAQDDHFYVLGTITGSPEARQLDVLKNDRDPDGEPLTASVAVQPTHGTAAAAADGLTLLYTPEAEYSGEDSLVYAADDGNLTMAATARIQVLPANHPPTAADDAFTVDADTQGNALTVLANDADADGDRLMIVAVGAPAQAGAQAEPNPLFSALLYTPAPGVSAGDSFTYTISDGEYRATARVNVVVNPATTLADLSLSRSVVPAALREGEAQAVTAIYTVANAGPAVAPALLVRDVWSVPPDAATVVSGGACTGAGNTLSCALADLPAGGSVTLVQYISFTPDAVGNITANATVSTAKTDPAPGDNQANATLTVSGPRQSRTLGELTLTADAFVDLGGGVTRATGQVVIGEHFYLAGAGAPASQATLDFDADGILSASGELRMIRGDYALFSGSFTADAATSLGAPDAGVDYGPLAQVAGFPVAGNAGIIQLDLLTGEVTGSAMLTFSGGEATAQPHLSFSVTPGPHFNGAASAPFEVLYGDGYALRLGAAEATLAKHGPGYELLAQGVLTYNLTHPLTDTQVYTPGIPGVYDTLALDFTLGSDGSVRERADSLVQMVLMVDYLELTLQPAWLDNGGVFAPQAALRMHTLLGGGAVYLENVTLTADGLSLEGQTLNLPDIVPSESVYTIRRPVGVVAAAEYGYRLVNFRGDLVLDMAQNHFTTPDFNLGSGALWPVPTAPTPTSALRGKALVDAKLSGTRSSSDHPPTPRRGKTLQDTKLSGIIIGPEGSWLDDVFYTKDKAFDGNTFSHYTYSDPSGGWVGLDLGSPYRIIRIRYHPRNDGESRMRGGKFQGANDENFTSGLVDLHTISGTPPAGWTEETVSNDTDFRYVRYLGRDWTYCEVAEVEFYGEPLDMGPTLIGTVIGTEGSNWDSGNTREKAFDGDTSTYFDAPDPDGAWVGLELGSPHQITWIRYYPRTDWWGYPGRMNGGKFQGANDRGFTSGLVDLHTISGTPSPGWSEVPVSSDFGFRYVRYLGPDGSHGNVAEVEFYGESGEPPEPPEPPPPTDKLSGTVIGTTGSYGGFGDTKEKVFDGDTSTYFYAPSSLGAWAGLDLGGPHLITRIRYHPCNGCEFGMTGGKFQGANDENFASGLVDLHTISGRPPAGWTDVTVSNATGFRYVRYLGPRGSWRIAAEVEFYGEPGESAPTKLSGPVIGTEGSYGGLGDTKEKVFDGDTSTFFDAPSADGAWAGLKLDDTYRITRIRYYPRTGYWTWPGRMNGGKFQGANNSHFTLGLVDLHTISSDPPEDWTEVTVSNDTGFRYVRYLGPDGSHGNVAEVEFYGEPGEPSGPEVDPTSDPDLVAHWTFDRLWGSNDFETLVSHYPDCDLMDQDTAPALVTGAIGRAVRFNGSDEYLEAGSPGTNCGMNFGSSQDFSIALWVKTSDPCPHSGFSGIIGNITPGGATESGFAIWYSCSAENWHITLRDGSNTRGQSVLDIADNQWHHLAMTVDRDYNVIVRLYQDGVRSADLWPTIGNVDSPNPLLVGRDPDGNYFQGSIDDVRIYRRALSEDEVAELYNAGNQPSLPIEAANTEISLSGATGSSGASVSSGATGSSATVSNGVLSVDSMDWTLPDILGGQTLTFDQGPTLRSGQHAAIPVPPGLELRFGRRGRERARFAVRSIELHLSSADELTLKIRGDVTVNVSGYEQQLDATLEIWSDGQVTGQVHSFAVTLAGFTVGGENVRVDDDTFKADSLTLGTAPPLFPFEGTLTGVEFTPPSDFSLTGGGINLPSINIGSIEFGLWASLEKQSDGTYKITAGGQFPLPIGRNTGLTAEVVLVADINRQRLYALPIDPQTGNLLQTPVGGEPVGIPLDPVSGQPLVVDSNAVPLAVPLDPALLEQQIIVVGAQEIPEPVMPPYTPLRHASPGVALDSLSLTLDTEIPLGNTGAYLVQLRGSASGLRPDPDRGTYFSIGGTVAYGQRLGPLGRPVNASLDLTLGLNIPMFRVQGESAYRYTRAGVSETFVDTADTNFGLPDHFERVVPIEITDEYSGRARVEDYNSSSKLEEMNNALAQSYSATDAPEGYYRGAVDFHPELPQATHGLDSIPNLDWYGKLLAHLDFDPEIQHYTPHFSSLADGAVQAHTYPQALPLAAFYVNDTLSSNDLAWFVVESQTCTYRNVAYGKNAYQSSTWYGFAHASRAVDGNTNGIWDDGVVACTEDEQQAWWEVDLGAVYHIQEIKIWNRTDCCQDRLHDFYVMVSETPLPSSDAYTNAKNARWLARQGSAIGDDKTWSNINTTGRYVRIQFDDHNDDDENILQLAEVAVFARDDFANLGTPGSKNAEWLKFKTEQCVIPCRDRTFSEGGHEVASVWRFKYPFPYPIDDFPYCIADWYWVERSDQFTIERWNLPWNFKMGGSVSFFTLPPVLTANLAIDPELGADAALWAGLGIGGIGSFDLNANLSTWCANNCANPVDDFALTAAINAVLEITLSEWFPFLSGLDMRFEIGAEFGKFNTPGGTQWGAKVRIKFDVPDAINWIPGVPDVVEFGAYIGMGSNGFTFEAGADTSGYQLVTRDRVQQALRAREQQAQRRAAHEGVGLGDVGDKYVPLNVDPALHFVPAATGTPGAQDAGAQQGTKAALTLQDVVADVYVAHNTNAGAVLQTTNDALTMTVTAPDGTEYVAGGSGPGVTFESYERAILAAGASPRAAAGQAGLRAVHGVDGAPNLDLWANAGLGDTLLFSNLAFTDTTAYAALPPGNYTLTFRQAGAAGTGTVVAQTNHTLAAGEDVTVLAVGAPGNLNVWVIEDDNVPRGDMHPYLRLVHAAPNAPRLRVRPVFGKDIFIDVGYAMSTDYVKKTSNGKTFQLFNQASGDWVADTAPLTLEPYGIHTLFVFEDAQGDIITHLARDAGPVGRARFVHAAEGLGNVDVALDGIVPWRGVVPFTVTQDVPLEVDVYNVAVMQGGNPLVTTTLVMTYGLDYALALVQEGASPVLHVITEANTIPFAPQQSDVRVAHLAPNTSPVEAWFAASITPSLRLAGDVAYGSVSDYGDMPTETYTVEVRLAGQSAALHTQPNLSLPQGASTLYLAEQGGGLALLHGLDTAVQWQRTDRLNITDAMTGTWQVHLHNAAVITDDYSFEMTGAMPETYLYGVGLVTDTQQAHVTWTVDGFEPNTEIELLMVELTQPENAGQVVTSTQVMELSSGLTETVVVSSVVGSDPIEGQIRALATFQDPNDPSLINGTPQTHTFSLATIPSGEYLIKVRVDDMVHPFLTESPTATLVVSHPWPATWTGNLQISDNRFRETVLGWTPLANPDVDFYELWIDVGAADPIAYRMDPATSVYTVPNLTAGQVCTVTLMALNYETQSFSYGGEVRVVPAYPDFRLTQMTALPALERGAGASVVVSVTSDLEPYPLGVMLLPGDRSAGIGLRVEPAVVTPTTQGVTTTVWISASQYIYTGSYTATLLAWSGGAERRLYFAPAVIASDFDIIPSATALNLTPAGADVTLAAIGYFGHDAEINLDVMDVPLGVQAQLDDEVISAGQQTTLRLTSTPLAQRGTFTLTVRADDGPIRHLVDVAVTVIMPDFAVTAPQVWQRINVTQTAVFTLNVALLDGWTPPVTLRVDPANAPSGSSLGLQTNGARLGLRTNEASLGLQTTDPPATSVTLDDDGVATLVVTPTEGTPLGLYLLPVTAESAGETHLVELVLLVDVGTLSIWQIAEPGVYVFGSTGAEIEVVDTGGCLDTITVIHVPETHRMAIPGLDTGEYWIIEQTSCATDGGNASQAHSAAPATFLANLTLAHPGTPDANDRVCRYDRTSREWDCAAHSYDVGAGTVTRNGVTRFSDWAVQVCDVVGDDLSVAFAGAEPGSLSGGAGEQRSGGAQHPVVLAARVTNDGVVQVPAGASVAFYVGDPNAGGTPSTGLRTGLIDTAVTTQALDPGESEEVSITWAGSTAGDHDIHVVVGGGSQVLCGPPPTTQQTVSILDVPLVEDWNLISSHVNPFNTDTSVVQRPIEGQYVVIQGFDQGAQSYYPELPPGVNTLTDVDGEHGYWVKTNSDQLSVIRNQSGDSAAQETVATLQVVGEKLAEDRGLELDAEWNLVSYLPRQGMAVPDALGDIDGQYSAVLGYDGGALSYYPDIDPSFNTLRTMKPLFGYWIKMGQAATLRYPTTAVGHKSPIPNTQYPIPNIRAAERAASVTPTHTWVNFYGTAQAWDEARLPVGVTVEALDADGVVCGAAVIHTEGQYGLLPCYGDDPTTPEDEGARPGDVIRLIVGDKVLAKGTWTAHGDRQWRPLGKSYTQQVYLPLIRKGD